MKQDADHKVDEPCIIARLSLDMEEIDPSFKEYRDKVKIIQKLNIMISSKRIPDMYTDFVPLLCLGTLTVNLRPLWADAKKCLVTFSQVNKDLYWNTIFGELSKYNDETSLVWDGFSRAVMDKLAQPKEPEIGNATKTGKISFECPTLSKFTFVENKAWVDMKEEKAQSLSIMFVQVCCLQIYIQHLLKQNIR
jgi:U3 small nucleolar RNA-associated protein 20